MDRKLTALLVVVSIAVGYLAHSELSKRSVVSPEQEFSFIPALVTKGKADFACTSIATTYVANDLTEGKVVGELKAGTDKLSLSFDYESNTMKLITSAAVEAGETEAETFTLVENDEMNAVAIAKHGVLGPNYSVIVFDKKKQQAIWTKTSDALFKMGSAMYLNCN